MRDAWSKAMVAAVAVLLAQPALGQAGGGGAGSGAGGSAGPSPTPTDPGTVPGGAGDRGYGWHGDRQPGSDLGTGGALTGSNAHRARRGRHPAPRDDAPGRPAAEEDPAVPPRTPAAQQERQRARPAGDADQGRVPGNPSGNGL